MKREPWACLICGEIIPDGKTCLHRINMSTSVLMGLGEPKKALERRKLVWAAESRHLIEVGFAVDQRYV